MAPRVLVLDDEPVIQRLLEQTLAGDGIEVAVVGTAEEAVTRLCEERFDVVLVDLLLPRPTGWQVLEQARQHPEWPRIVVVSAKATPVNLRRAFELGAVDVVGKPFDPVALSSLVVEVASLRPDEVERHRRMARARCNVS